MYPWVSKSRHHFWLLCLLDPFILWIKSSSQTSSHYHFLQFSWYLKSICNLLRLCIVSCNFTCFNSPSYFLYTENKLSSMTPIVFPVFLTPFIFSAWAASCSSVSRKVQCYSYPQVLPGILSCPLCLSGVYSNLLCGS